MRNPIDADRVKLFSGQERKDYQRQAHEYDGGCNDAELVAEMRRQGTLTKLNPNSYKLPSVRTSRPTEETDAGNGFRKGERVLYVERDLVGKRVTVGVVQSVAGSFLRIGGRLYHYSMCTHA